MNEAPAVRHQGPSVTPRELGFSRSPRLPLRGRTRFPERDGGHRKEGGGRAAETEPARLQQLAEAGDEPPGAAEHPAGLIPARLPEPAGVPHADPGGGGSRVPGGQRTQLAAAGCLKAVTLQFTLMLQVFGPLGYVFLAFPFCNSGFEQ